MNNPEELLKALAKFMVEHGSHKEWCNSTKSCTCGYGEIFDTANQFLKLPVENEFLSLAHSVEVIQDQLGRVLGILETLVNAHSEKTSE